MPDGTEAAKFLDEAIKRIWQKNADAPE